MVCVWELVGELVAVCVWELLTVCVGVCVVEEVRVGGVYNTSTEVSIGVREMQGFRSAL